MNIALILGFNLIICQTILAWSPGDSQPHIVFVMADDLGMYVNDKKGFLGTLPSIFNYLTFQGKVERGGSISFFDTSTFCAVE